MRKLISVIFICLSLGACASHYGAARITSIPSGAEVINADDGSNLGVTPTTVVWKDGSTKRKFPTLYIKKSGYYIKTTPFWLHMKHSSSEKAKQSPDLVKVVLVKKDNY